jgi:GxxExxY protein
MKRELFLRKLNFLSELIVPVLYKGIDLDAELRCDLLVEDSIVVEIKSVDLIEPVFEAQLLTYMKLLQKPKGILINFNCVNLFKEGQKTYVNELYRNMPDD